MFEPAIELLDSIHPLESDVKDYLLQNVERYSYPKKHILVSAGKIDRSVYVIRKGVVRVFRFVDGKEYTTWLFPENDFAVSLEGFYAGEPAQDSLEMLEDGEVTVIRGEVIDHLCHNYLSFNQLYRKVVSKSLLRVVHYLQDLQTLQSEQVYENFINKSAELNLKVPQKYVASFLGMHEKNLPRVKHSFQTKHSRNRKKQ